MKFSPTRLKQARCLRRYAAESLAGFSEPPRKATNLGLEIHRLAEVWLKTKEAPPTNTDAGKAFHRVIPLLGEYRTEEFCTEDRISFELEGYVFRGFADFHNECRFGDWKSTSNPHAYSLSDEQLVADEQFNVYGYWYTLEYQQLSGQGDWVYIPTRNRKPLIRTAKLEQSRSEDFLGETLIPRCEDMLEIKESWDDSYGVEHLNMLPHNPQACEHAGVFCGFAQHCNILSKTKELDMGSLAERLEAKAREKAKENKQKMDFDKPETVEAAVQEAEAGGVPPEAPVEEMVEEVKPPRTGRKKASKKTHKKAGSVGDDLDACKELVDCIQTLKKLASACGFDVEIRLK